MTSSQKNRRKNYFIDKDFQTKFILKFCIVIICASVFSAILIYYCNTQTTTVAFEDLRVTVKTTSDFIMPIVLQILSIVTLFAGCLTIIVTLFASHKIAGPLYKLKMELDVMKEGNLTRPIRIRSTDQLQQVATDFDELRIHLATSLKAIQTKCDRLESLAQNLDANELKKVIQEIDTELKKYTV